MKSILPIDALYGRVRVTNADGFESYGRNTVVYTGADIVAKLLGGNTSYAISHFYFEYQNTAGTPAPQANGRGLTAATVRSYLTSDKDLIRAQISGTPSPSASSASYNYNQCTFTAVSNATTGLLNGLAFTAAANSKVMAVCMVAAPTGAVAGDVLYARYVLGTAVPVVGGGQVASTWLAGAT